MASANRLITDYLDIWSSAVKRKSSAGRGNSKRIELYGIKKLRHLIMELAVRGLLVKQDPEAESASGLVENIKAEKAKLIKEGRIKKEKPAVETDKKDTPFELPNGWIWQRITDVFYPISVSKNKVKTSELSSEGAYPVVDQGQTFIAGYVNDGDLLNTLPGPVIVFGDHTSALKYIDFDFVAGADGVKILRPLCMNEKYFFLVCKTLPIESRGYGRHYSRLIDNFFPLPPLTEQHRIVAKVDALMKICDSLEENSEANITNHKTLVHSLLNTLINAADNSTVNKAWSCIAKNFNTLFTTERSVEQLKQTILQLAVTGRLVPQISSDLPAIDFLRNIETEKSRLVKTGRIKKEKISQQPEFDKELSPIPANWTVTRLKAISTIGTGATPSRDQNDYYFPAIHNWVTSGETALPFIHETKEKISEKAIRETNATVYPAGTLIVAMYGQGKTRGQITELLIPAATNQACAAIQLFEPSPEHRAYIKLFIQKSYEELRSLAEGGAQPNLNIGKLANTLIPIPPLAEQRRIVAKVDELMSMCECLKASLCDLHTIQLQLADAIADKALEKNNGAL
ncbi:hypothetical protein PspS35_00855 [Pseudomonas sp. S35]|uniref:restriction endonuclease subunit S n=1 Tax=Pseudomonas sp. S35 TaxID=1573719 RepID=UPI00132EFB59|nr:restriction endonuclease subunit S [Pseudomonas sp. S35]QHF42399.1 hypothetical protein PspS35_00855 [Pseudomonas sp. S35]